MTRFAFLECYFFYAYNDWERYQTAIFDNEHEGDDEDCCLVFDRNVLNLAAATGDLEMLQRVVPHSLITSVHEEYQDADLFKFIPTPVPNPANPNPLARDVVDVTVYVAGGSHATYLTPGAHDVVDFGDYWGWVDENARRLRRHEPAIYAKDGALLPEAARQDLRGARAARRDDQAFTHPDTGAPLLTLDEACADLTEPAHVVGSVRPPAN